MNQARRDEELVSEDALLLGRRTHFNDELARARRILYVSHFFAMFSDVTWQFCLILFLAAFTNYESLILVSTYGLSVGLSVCLLGSLTGQFIDNNNRLFTAKRFIWAENTFVILATTLSYLLLNRQIPDSAIFNVNTQEQTSFYTIVLSRLNGVPMDTTSLLLLIGIHIFGTLAEVLAKGFKVAVERDWVVVMSKWASRQTNTISTPSTTTPTTTKEEKDAAEVIERAWLSETNVAMKQIDLSCKVVAPAIAGFLIAFLIQNGGDDEDQDHGRDVKGAALIVGILNVASLVAEYLCMNYIYGLIPSLAIKPTGTDETATTQLERACHGTGCGVCSSLPRGLKVYMEQPVAWGGLGFALLYLNALTFGALMTAYLVFRGMSFSTVGVWRGISSAIGLLGTVAYHVSVKYLSVESTGLWSIMYQFACLSLSYASLFVEDNVVSLTMLIAGVCASRIGLWVFDITITQLMQEYVSASARGVTGGVQQSLNAFFGLLAFCLGIVFPDPREFHLQVAAGYASVGIGMIMYVGSIYLRRHKLRTLTSQNHS